MKRFALLTIAVIVIASTTGCRRGLRLWGTRGAPCTPTASPIPGGMPGAYAAPNPNCPPAAPPQATMMPTCPCPEVQSAPIDCGCATEGMPYDSAYSGGTAPQILPGETLVGDSVLGGGAITQPPAEFQQPIIPQFNP